MFFVGVISNNRDFKNIQKAFSKKDILKNISLVRITEDNIKNVRNISFETILFCKKFDYSNSNIIYLDKICNNANYIVLNSDFVFHIPPSYTEKCTIITFGLNQNATVTVSSISDNGFVLSLRKNIIKKNHKLHEMEEKCIKTKNTNNYQLYKLIIEYIIKIIYEIP